jgi:geranylgeranyl diphosphate synthase type 3/geranylgeranyl diphosphate synthase type I
MKAFVLKCYKNLSNKQLKSLRKLKHSNKEFKKYPFIFFQNFSKIHQSNFSTTNKINYNNNNSSIMKEYKTKIDNSLHIFEEIFHKEIKTRNQLIDYFDFKSISTNVCLEGSTPLKSINHSIFFPCWDMVERGGKRWRPILGLMIADIFKIDLSNPNKNENQKLYYKLLFLVESLHNASLILDDVEDKSESRRNLPCVHKTFGEAIAINAGISFLFFPFYKIIQHINDPLIIADLSKYFFQELSAIHIGQGWDIEMNINKRTPSIENYSDTVLMKTGVFPRLIVKLLKVLIKNEMSKNKISDKQLTEVEKIFESLIHIVDNMSIVFQIKDDLLNITDSELAKGKGFFGEDIFEGKLTLMILHSLNKKACSAQEAEEVEKNKNRLREILDMKTKDPQLIKEAVDILIRNESVQFAECFMKQHVDKANWLCEKLINEIEKSDTKDKFDIYAVRYIKTLISYLIDRSI